MQEKYFDVKKMIEITNGELIYGDEKIVCKTFSRDTRTINENDV